jgi:hypothetical protein
MRCETCQGEGSVPDEPPVLKPGEVGYPTKVMARWLRRFRPCPTCGGCGIASCCDGMVEVTPNE